MSRAGCIPILIQTGQMEDVELGIQRARAIAEEKRRQAKAERAAREASDLEQRRAEVLHSFLKDS